MLGFAVFAAGQATSAVALGLAPGSVVATLGSFSLVVNVALASAVLGERVLACDIVATCAILLGDAVAVAFSGDTPPPPLHAARLFHLLQRPGFVRYALVLTAAGILSLLGFCALAPGNAGNDEAERAAIKLEEEVLDAQFPRGTPRRNRVRKILSAESAGCALAATDEEKRTRRARAGIASSESMTAKTFTVHTPPATPPGTPPGSDEETRAAGGGVPWNTNTGGTSSGSELSDAELLNIVDVLARAEENGEGNAIAMEQLRALAQNDSKASPQARRRASSLLVRGGGQDDARLVSAAMRGEIKGEKVR